MSTYEGTLPEVFPYAWGVPIDTAQELISALLSGVRSDSPVGSSFAYTIENAPYSVTLWLSEASYNYLRTRWDVIDIDYASQPREDSNTSYSY